ncbi:MAG: nucleotidyl transferase AbiEii/AbiGii toxin family protein [Kineosporiaceae bacterium]
MSGSEYRDGAALWRAISDRARTAAKATGRPANELTRRFVYDRFLARVFADPEAPWVLKGGTAVLARVHDARHSKDVDLLRSLGDIEDALVALRQALEIDLSDHFRFVIVTEKQAGNARQPQVTGYRLKVDAYCGTRRCESFSVDLVTGSLMTAAPDAVSPNPPIEVPGVVPATVRAYPVVDHIADKLAATEAVYSDGTRSSRTRDLVDLVVFARTQTIDGEALYAAIAGERHHRGLPLSSTFGVPRDWVRDYPAIAAKVPHCDGLHDLADAEAFVAAFLEPAMTGSARGASWDPDMQKWTRRTG